MTEPHRYAFAKTCTNGNHLKPRTKKFLSFYKPYLKLLAIDLLCAFVVSAVVLAFPLCVRYITKNILEAKAPDALNQICLTGAAMILLIVVQTVCNTFVDYQGHMMGTLMESDMRTELFEHYQKLSFRFYDDQKTGQLMSRITNDTFAIGELCHHAPEDCVFATLKFVGAFAILLTINVPLTLIVICFLLVMAAYAFHFYKIMNVALRASKNRIGDINAQAEDSLAGIRVVQSFANEGIETRKFAIENSRFVESMRAAHRNEAYFYDGMTAFTQLLTVVAVVCGGVGILKGALDLPNLLAYLLYIGILIEPIRSALNILRVYQEGKIGFDRFMEMLEIEPEFQDATTAVDVEEVVGNVVCTGVGFKYAGGNDYVLKNISLDIKVGEFVALVGASGVGKTTLCSLIPRFYEVSEGGITIDGKDIR